MKKTLEVDKKKGFAPRFSQTPRVGGHKQSSLGKERSIRVTRARRYTMRRGDRKKEKGSRGAGDGRTGVPKKKHLTRRRKKQRVFTTLDDCGQGVKQL